MDISVIIPVYNAQEYLERCLESILIQKEVLQIIAVDDGSEDSSAEIINTYGKNHKKIEFHRHEAGKNLGRAATRNLGLSKAKSSWIAFLDADDYYLPGRFEHVTQRPNKGIDGFYDSIQTEYSKPKYRAVFNDNFTGIRTNVEPTELFRHLVLHDEDHISLNGLTVRKRCCLEIGGFDRELEIGEDTDFVWRLAKSYRLIPGEKSDPVAVRYVHGKNSYFDRKRVFENRRKFYLKWKEITDHPNTEGLVKQKISEKAAYYGRTPAFRRLFNSLLQR